MHLLTGMHTIAVSTCRCRVVDERMVAGEQETNLRRESQDALVSRGRESSIQNRSGRSRTSLDEVSAQGHAQRQIHLLTREEK